MQVNAEIHLGTRTVLEYLLSPIQRVAHEAGRERQAAALMQLAKPELTLFFHGATVRK